MTTANGRRLLAIRELAGENQSEMAKALEITQPRLSQIEKAERPLTAELIARAATRYALPESFFHVAPSVLDVSVATFRKNSSARVADERRIVRLYREAARAFELTSEQSGYHPTKIPTDFHTLDVEEAASRVRELNGLSPTEPIPNMVRFLERLGFGVITQLDDTANGHDAAHVGISIPNQQVRRPLIALPRPCRGDVMRFTLGHETAHHIWDQGLTSPSQSTRSAEERRAHAFAGALLLPLPVLKERITPTLNLNGYLPIKAEYGISVGAIIMAAKRAKILTPERARSLQIQLSSRGWRSEEPVQVAPEQPLLFRQALEKITGGSTSSMEALTGLPVEWFERWTGSTFLAPPVDLASWRRRQ